MSGSGRILSCCGLACSILAAAGGPAAGGERFSVAVSGGLAPLESEWSSAANWLSWAEQAHVDSRHTAASGPVLGGAFGWRVTRHWGAVASFTSTRRDASATLEASLPHPLYVSRAREIEGRVEGLSHREMASHLDLEWRTFAGPLEVALFGGGTLARVKTHAIGSVQATEAYPYDEASFRAADSAAVTSKWTPGWNAGFSAAWLFSSRFDLGVETRYSQAKVDLDPAKGDPVTIDAGGLELTGRLRLRF